MLYFLFYCFSSLVLTSASLVILSRNPIFSILFLVLCFCNSSIIIFLVGLEFLPTLFVLVYVGALAVLFLFVIMTLNLKISETLIKDTFFILFAVILLLLFFFEFVVLIKLQLISLDLQHDSSIFLSGYSDNSFYYLSCVLFFVSDSNIFSIGKVLFKEFWIPFFIAGYILLFAMVSSITLTLQKRFFSKTQNVYFQVLRNFNSCLLSFY